MRYEMNDLLKLYSLDQMEKSKPISWKISLKFRFVSYFANLLETLSPKPEEECKTMILVEQRNIESCFSYLKILQNFCEKLPGDCKLEFSLEELKKTSEKFYSSVEKLCKDSFSQDKILSELKKISLTSSDIKTTQS